MVKSRIFMASVIMGLVGLAISPPKALANDNPALGIGEPNTPNDPPDDDDKCKGPDCDDCKGNSSPIYAKTGDFFRDFHDLTYDHLILPFAIARHYDSGDFFVGFFGRGFHSTLDMMSIGTIKGGPSNEVVVVRYPDGRRTLFTRQPDATYASTAGRHDTLRKVAGGFELTVDYGDRLYHFDDGTKLLRIEDRNGNETLFSYDAGGRPTTITLVGGRQINISYGSNGLVDTITDYRGRVMQYGYDAAGHLTSVTNALNETTTYQYTGDKLSGIINPLAQAVLTLTYDAQGRVSTIVDEEGSFTYTYVSATQTRRTDNVTGGLWTYVFDANGAVTSTTDPLGRVSGASYGSSYNINNLTLPEGNVDSFMYDSEGRVIRITNPEGNSTNYTFNALGLIESETSPELRVTRYEYDARGNLTRFIRGFGSPQESAVQYAYDAAGNVTSQTDPNLRMTMFAYDASGRRTLTTDPAGFMIMESYDAADNLTQVVDKRGNTTQYEYDALGRTTRTTNGSCFSENFYDAAGNLTRTIDANGRQTDFEYNAYGLVTKTTDAELNENRREYDSHGNLTRIIDPANRTYTIAYDLVDRESRLTAPDGSFMTLAYNATTRRKSETDARNFTTHYDFDRNDRLTRITNALGGAITVVHDRDANPVSTTDERSLTTTYSYDALNRMTRTTNPAGGQTLWTYDAAGNILTATDRNALTTTYQYSSRNELTREVDACGDAIEYEYDGNGNLTRRRLPNGNEYVYTYDAMDRLLSTSDSTGLALSRTFDCGGNVLSETDARGSFSAVYNGVNLIASAIDANGQSVALGYDPVGNLTSYTDREGNAALHTYDGFDHRTSTTFMPAGGGPSYSIQTVHDSNDNVLSRTDARGNVSTYEYDALNRLTRQVNADMADRAFGYDAVGNLTSRQDELDCTTTYQYDNLNRLTRADRCDASFDTFTYDAGDRRLTAGTAAGLATYAYDCGNRVVSAVQSDVPQTYSHTIGYAYNGALNTRTITYPSGKVVVETRDQRDRLASVMQNAAASAAFTYDGADGVLTRSYANGARVELAYNANAWTTQLRHFDGVGSTFGGFDYTADAQGNRLTAANALAFDSAKAYTHSESYSYDSIYRLIGYARGEMSGGEIPSPESERTWTLDAAGNWTQFAIDGVSYSATPNNVNEYDDPSTNGAGAVPDDDGLPDDFLVPPGLNFAHDKNGNLVNDGSRTYAYDKENRLTRVTRQSDSMVLADYTYDALGRRISATSGGTTTIYVYDKDRVVEEYVGGALSRSYAYGQGVDELLTMDDGGGNRYYYHPNSLGSAIALTDSSGSPAEYYSYDAYGAPAFFDGAGATIAASAVGNNYLFTGREYDPNTGDYNYRARAYDPFTGRFLQRDPSGIWTDSENLGNGYAYTADNPINKVDPTGLDSPGCCGVPDFLETECRLECCAEHDRCYHANNCTSSSWAHSLPGSKKCPKCAKCNRDAVKCFVVCQTPWRWFRKDRPDYYDRNCNGGRGCYTNNRPPWWRRSPTIRNLF